MYLLISLLLSVAPENPPAHAVVVAAPEFREAMKPWTQLREQQGCRLEWLSPERPEKIHERCRQLHAADPLTHVLLVGDVDARDPRTDRPIGVPAYQLPAEVNVLFGSEPTLGSDNPYGDFDGDNIPDVAVGRFSADTPLQLADMVSKTVRYERDRDFGPWRQRVNLVAGVGGFGSVIDSTLEVTTKEFLRGGIPAGYQTKMTYGSWRSPYCPNPLLFQQTVNEQLSEGCLFWVYIGHGHPERLDRVHVPGGAYPILEKRDVPRLNCQHGWPIAVLLSCYTGAYDFPRDCLAEDLVRAPGGPVAALAGSRVTMPYANSVLTNELMRETFENHPPTLGEIILGAKRNAANWEAKAKESESPKIDNRQWIEALGRLLSPRPDLLAAERLEHIAMFNLLGDPLLRIAYPEAIDLRIEEETRAGDVARLQIKSPHAGKCTLQLVCRRDCLTFQPPSRDAYPTDVEKLDTLQKTYQQANDHRFAEQTFTIKPGTFLAEIAIPEEARGPCQIRAYIEGENRFALGGADVFVRRARSAESAAKDVGPKTR